LSFDRILSRAHLYERTSLHLLLQTTLSFSTPKTGAGLDKKDLGQCERHSKTVDRIVSPRPMLHLKVYHLQVFLSLLNLNIHAIFNHSNLTEEDT